MRGTLFTIRLKRPDSDPGSRWRPGAKHLNQVSVPIPMVHGSRLLLTVAVVLLSTVSLAGCLQDLVLDPNCPTVVSASWTQDGIADAFPEEGVQGDYNVSVHIPDGMLFEDPEWGELVLSSVQWDPGWKENATDAVFRVDKTGRINITLPDTFDQKTLQDGFLSFITRLTPLTEEAANEWVGPLLESRHDVPTVRAQGAATTADTDSLVEYNLTFEGPFAFESLYDRLLQESDHEERPDPWLEDHVDLDDWRFSFPSPLILAEHVDEDDRFLQVDARDRVEFYWDPPAGASQQAIMAGITRTLSDLGLPAPPEADAMDFHVRSC